MYFVWYRRVFRVLFIWPKLLFVCALWLFCMLASSPGSFKFSMLYGLYIKVHGATLKIGGSLHAWLTLLWDSATFWSLSVVLLTIKFCCPLIPNFYQLRHALYYSILNFTHSLKSCVCVWVCVCVCVCVRVCTCECVHSTLATTYLIYTLKTRCH